MGDQLRIHNSLSDRLVLGLLVFRETDCRNPAELKNYITARLPAILARHARQIPQGYASSRRLYRECGMDPTRYRPSSESLWRRLKKGGNFPFWLPPVDLVNLLALEHQISYGLYDLRKIEGEVEVRTGQKGESYDGLGRGRWNLEGRLALCDRLGPFGNPSSDSVRTSVDSRSRNLLLTAFFHRGFTEVADVMSDTRDRFSRFFTTGEIRYEQV